jgi:hypothetical protein
MTTKTRDNLALDRLSIERLTADGVDEIERIARRRRLVSMKPGQRARFDKEFEGLDNTVTNLLLRSGIWSRQEAMELPERYYAGCLGKNSIQKLFAWLGRETGNPYEKCPACNGTGRVRK